MFQNRHVSKPLLGHLTPFSCARSQICSKGSEKGPVEVFHFSLFNFCRHLAGVPTTKIFPIVVIDRTYEVNFKPYVCLPQLNIEGAMEYK